MIPVLPTAADCFCSVGLDVGLCFDHHHQFAVSAGCCSGAHPQPVLLQVSLDLPSGTGSGNPQWWRLAASTPTRKLFFCDKQRVNHCKGPNSQTFQLLPYILQSQGGHNHSHEGHTEEEPVEDFLTKFDGVWKGLTALAGIYLLFIIEHCIGMFKHYSDQRVRCHNTLKFKDWK